jgi:MFS family permease
VVRASAARPLPPDVLPVATDCMLVREGENHRVSYRVPIPYFGLLWRPLVARRARRIEAAADASRPLPSDLPWWAPPEHLDERASVALAGACLITLLWSYGGGTLGLLSQTLPYAAETYDVGDRALGTGLAIVRGGVALALVLGVLADRFGRRAPILPLVVAHCLLAGAIGLAPSFEIYIAGHVALRCLDTALGIALAVLVVEIVPAGSRAISLALVGVAAGGGVSLAVASLPIAASGRAGFAAVYLLQLLALPLAIHAARRLEESPRFLEHAGERHGYRELLRGPYRGRLALVGGTAFLAAVFIAPALEFVTRYLDRSHDFSSFEIVAFLAVTGLPSFPALIAGGRLADLYGRKPVGVPLVAASATAYAGFFLAPSPWIWPLALAGAVLGSAGGAALAPYDSELFATRIRSVARSTILALAVAGSAFGLLSVGLLSQLIGLGPAIASLAVLPLAAAAIVLLRFPETARLELEVTAREAVNIPPERTLGGRP